MRDRNERVWGSTFEDVFILPMSINFIQGYFSIMFEFFIFKKETLEIIVKQ